MKSLDLIPCEPPFWARSGHAQTVWGHLLPSPRLKSPSQHHEIALPDGDRLLAKYLAGSSDTVVYIFHGLSGDASVDYMERTAQSCLELGHSVYLVNHRGCGAGELLATRPYHSGRGEDISEMLAFGKARHFRKRHLAVGFSLSGNALLCLLTGLRGTVLPDAAIAVNAPIDLQLAVTALKRGFNRVYEKRFVFWLRKNLKERQVLGLIEPHYSIPRRSRLYDFDSLYTAPAGGFASAEDYYEQCSTKNHLAKIKVPTYLLTAEDDPFVPFEAYAQAKLSPSTILHAEKNGGHMGYLHRVNTPLGSRRWMDYAIKNMVRQLSR